MLGLIKYEAEQLLKKFCYNELPSAKPKNLMRIALEVIKEPMFLLLLACASIYLLVGDHTEGVIMFFSIVLIISIAFESEQDEINIMSRPPHPVSERFLGNKQIMSSSFRGILLFVVILVVYFISNTLGYQEDEIRGITFTAIIMGNVVMILSNLSKTRSFIALILEKNISTSLIISLALILNALILFIPILQELFKVQAPDVKGFIASVLGGIGIGRETGIECSLFSLSK
jgi:magnesium-transporting ATPase (P-type)